MGAITGRPDRRQIHSFLSSFKEAGFTQYMIYPRSGCELEYLSEEWFNTCEIIISECQALGFDSVWLYDEFNWPSGQCGGRIMKEDPDHALKYFQVFEKNGEYSFGISSNPKAPDVLNPGAMKKFIEYTHEKYAERFGHLFGTLIKGFFTDEPAISYIGSPSGDEKIRLSYYPGLEEDYTALTGSSLRKDIIFTLRNQSAPFWKNFVCKLLGQRFLDSFVLPIRSWCDRHDLLFTGHLLAEHTLKDSFRASGSPMKVADGFSLPAIDEIATASQIHSVEWITLATAEHAMRKNGNGGMAELFALGPCDMTLAKIKRQIHLVSLFGTDRYLLAISPFDMRGNTCGAKSQYFNPFTGAQPFFPAFAALNRDVCASAAVARKEFLPEIEIRRPTDEAQLSELLIQLVKAQRQWRLIDEEEEGTAPAVLRIEQEGISTEKMPDGSYHRCASFTTFLKIFEKILPLKNCVTDSSGRLAEDIFMRYFADGSVEIINLSASRENRRLTLIRSGSKFEFELSPDGIKSFAPRRILIDRPNLKRLEFEEGICKLYVTSPLEDVVFLARQHELPAALEVDGVPLALNAPAEVLPEGFTPFYLSSAPLSLKHGEHIIKVSDPALPEYPFLPTAFLAGFFADTGKGLAPYAQDGVGLEQFIGRITQQEELEIPAWANTLSFEADDLYTELYINGEKMAERLNAPYIWRIPERFAGKKVEIKIERCTSCGPMFGEKRFDNLRPGDMPGWLNCSRPSGKVQHPVVEIVFQ